MLNEKEEKELPNRKKCENLKIPSNRPQNFPKYDENNNCSKENVRIFEWLKAKGSDYLIQISLFYFIERKTC